MRESTITIFIDRNSGGKALRNQLTDVGIKVVLHDDLFPKRTPDEDWLKEISRLGHVIVTGDKNVTRRPVFLAQLEKSPAHIFILFGMNAGSSDARANCIITAYARFDELMRRHPAPAIWRISQDNKEARRFDHSRVLAKMHASKRF